MQELVDAGAAGVDTGVAADASGSAPVEEEANAAGDDVAAEDEGGVGAAAAVSVDAAVAVVAVVVPESAWMAAGSEGDGFRADAAHAARAAKPSAAR